MSKSLIRCGVGVATLRRFFTLLRPLSKPTVVGTLSYASQKRCRRRLHPGGQARSPISDDAATADKVHFKEAPILVSPYLFHSTSSLKQENHPSQVFIPLVLNNLIKIDQKNSPRCRSKSETDKEISVQRFF